MAGVTPIAGLPYPELGDDPNIELVSKPLAQELDDQIVPRFATATARNTAITAPIAGQVCWVATNGLMVYDGTTWLPQAGIEVCRLAMTADFASVSGIDTQVPFGSGSQEYLPFGGHSTTTNNARFVLPFPGRYLASGSVAWFATASGVRGTVFQKNGVTISSGGTRMAAAAAVQLGTLAATTFSANGTTDYVTLAGFQNTGSPLNMLASVAGYSTGMSVIYLGRAW